MGDVAMTVPVIQSFVKQHPEAKITFVSRSFLQPLFYDIENVSFFSVDTTKAHKGFFGLIRLFKELKSIQPTHFADFHNVLRSKVIRLLFSFFTSVKIAVIDKGRTEKKALTRVKNKIFKQLKTSHQRYTDVLIKLGFDTKIDKDLSTNKQQLSQQNTELFGEKNLTWIGIAPFAAFSSKTYPEDLMLEVVQGLSKENVQLFLFGGKADIEKLESIESKFSNVISVAGKLDGLKEELNLISNLDVMLSMDSGNAHFAAMLGVKTITLWGSTHPYAGFAPFNQPNDFCILPDLEKYPALPSSIYGNKILPGYENAMRSILPTTVVQKIKEII